MSASTPNVAASVRARLLNAAKAQGVDFNQVLVRFALERILYRLTQSAHADRSVLKGALLFTLWYDMPHRATRDADLTAPWHGNPAACCRPSSRHVQTPSKSTSTVTRVRCAPCRYRCRLCACCWMC